VSIFKTVRDEKEAHELIDKISETQETSGSNFPGMSYEEGIKGVIDWLSGNTDSNPMDD